METDKGTVSRVQTVDFTVERTVRWTRQEETWLVTVANQDGDILNIGIGDDAIDLLVTLDRFLLPPGE